MQGGYVHEEGSESGTGHASETAMLVFKFLLTAFHVRNSALLQQMVPHTHDS